MSKMPRAVTREMAINTQRQTRLPASNPNTNRPKMIAFAGFTETVVEAKRLASTKNKPTKARYAQNAKGYRQLERSGSFIASENIAPRRAGDLRPVVSANPTALAVPSAFGVAVSRSARGLTGYAHECRPVSVTSCPLASKVLSP